MARVELSTETATGIAAGHMTGNALFELGLRYCNGNGVEPDLVTAHKWFNLAAMRGNTDALTYRQEIAMELSSAEIAEAQRQARDWLSMH